MSSRGATHLHALYTLSLIPIYPFIHSKAYLFLPHSACFKPHYPAQYPRTYQMLTRNMCLVQVPRGLPPEMAARKPRVPHLPYGTLHGQLNAERCEPRSYHAFDPLHPYPTPAPSLHHPLLCHLHPRIAQCPILYPWKTCSATLSSVHPHPSMTMTMTYPRIHVCFASIFSSSFPAPVFPHFTKQQLAPSLLELSLFRYLGWSSCVRLD